MRNLASDVFQVMDASPSDEETLVMLSVGSRGQLQTSSLLFHLEDLCGKHARLMHHVMKRLVKHELLMKLTQTRGKNYRKRFEALSKLVI